MEDMDCWDCETMGNLICGPVEQPTPEASSVVVVRDQPTTLAYTGTTTDTISALGMGALVIGVLFNRAAKQLGAK